jgi:hypothetical protein
MHESKLTIKLLNVINSQTQDLHISLTLAQPLVYRVVTDNHIKIDRRQTILRSTHNTRAHTQAHTCLENG